VAELKDGSFVIPLRWIKVDEMIHADAYAVEFNNEV
jgi:hypothetical protein